jgi:hypothetical protein
MQVWAGVDDQVVTPALDQRPQHDIAELDGRLLDRHLGDRSLHRAF